MKETNFQPFVIRFLYWQFENVVGNIPKENEVFYLGLSGRALSGETGGSGRSVCCLSEASFRRDSERRERSSPDG